jgi:CheY-like chemotaxis protein
MLRILYLDDCVKDLELMRAALDQQGVAFQLVEATNKAEFVAALDSGAFDMIFSDSGVPGFDGKEALALVRDLRSQTLFIFLTGHSDGPVLDALKRLGADDILSKHHLQWLGGAIGRALRMKKKPPG